MRLLVVEDDPLLGDGLAVSLREEGYEVDWAQDGARAIELLHAHRYATVILDLNLPTISGLEVLRRLRESGRQTPVLILSARDRTDDRVAGLDQGADDYVTKPFELEELLARVRALTRRGRAAAVTTISRGRLCVDAGSHTVRWDNAVVPLSRREYDLLLLLLENLGKVVSRPQMEAHIYPGTQQIESNAVEVHIHSLRRKLCSSLIRTVRGVGYIVDREAE
ncbi:MAG: response regulator transcription factor [Gammaproteobacteria bacterium]